MRWRGQRSRVVTCVRFCVIAAIVWPASLSAQRTSASIGGYAARHGLGAEAMIMVHERAGPVFRIEGFGVAVENAMWLGARVNVVSGSNSLVYVSPLVGTHYCSPNNFSGTGSGCDFDAEWTTGYAVVAGFDLLMGPRHPWSVGAESGHRFVEAGSRSRWVFAATVRYRFYS